MKKLLTILCLVFLSLPVVAEYKPIPADRQEVFKIEIFKTINKEIPKTKKRINKIVVKYQKEKDISTKHIIKSIGINTEIFVFYMKLINVIEKYVPIKENIPTTDFYPILEEIIFPYLKNNNIPTKQIEELILFSEEKQKIMGSFP